MTDVFIGSARQLFGQSLDALRSSIEGASTELLNRRPAGEGTNSMAVLAVHVMHSTRSWLSVALGAPLPERDRPSEFRASATDAASLLSFVHEMRTDCERVLATDDAIDWAAMRGTHARPNSDDPSQVPAAWALLHALEHLREHVAHLQLTRQLGDPGWTPPES